MNEKERELTQIGNYLLGYEDDGALLRVRSVSGSWQLSWGYDSYMYSVLSCFLRDAKTYDYIEALLTMFFACTNYPHDMVSIATRQSTPFMNGFTQLVNEETAYEVSVEQKATEKEDEEALADVVRLREAEEELDELDRKEAALQPHTEPQAGG